MHRRAAFLLISLCLRPDPVPAAESAASPADGVPAFRGPLVLRCQNPLFLIFFRFAPSDASVPAAGDGTISVTSDYSSFFLADESPDETNLAVLDGELWRTALRATVGLGRGLALSVELPVLYGNSGFLDHVIEEYHSTFGFDQGGRDKNLDDQFVFVLASNERTAFFLSENELDLGDVSATLDWLAWEETDRRPAILLRAGVELPTGNEKMGYGNGGTDFGVAFASAKGLGRYRLFGGIGYQRLEEPRRFTTVGTPIRDTWSADFTAERPVGRQISLIAQLGYERSPLRNLDLPNVDSDSMTLAVSVSWSVSSRWILDFSFQEDLDGETSQDLTGHFGASWRF